MLLMPVVIGVQRLNIYCHIHLLDMIAWEHLSMLPNSLTMLTYWSQWEAARYCMLSRLRTPFGGPQQTFDSLEKQLNALLQQEQIPTMNDNLRLVLGLVLMKTKFAPT